LKEEALDHPLWRTRLERDSGPVARQTIWWTNELSIFHDRKPIRCL